MAYGTRGIVLRKLGRWRDAADAHERALGLLEAGGDLVSAAQARMGLAEALADGAASMPKSALGGAPGKPLDEDERRQVLRAARGWAEAARDAFEAAGAEGLQISAEETLGRVLAQSGEIAAAQALLDRVRAHADQLGLCRTASSAARSLAELHLRQGRWKEAASQALAGLDVLARIAASDPAGDATRALSQRVDLVDLGVRSSAEGNQAGDAHLFLERGRASALLAALGGRASALRAAVPEVLAREHEAHVRAKMDAIDAYAQARGANPRAAKGLWNDYLQRAREEAAVLERVEQAEEQAARLLAPATPVSLQRVEQRLAELDTMRLGAGRQGLPSVLVSFSFQGDVGVAILSRASGSRIVTYDAAAMRDIRDALAAVVLSQKLVHVEGEPRPRVPTIRTEAIDRLRKRLVDPLGLPGGPLRVLVSPDRELALVPLVLLFGSEVRAAYVPSATVLDLLCEQAQLTGSGVVALGDPAYHLAGDPEVFTSRGGPRLRGLPATRVEVETATPDPKRDVRLLGPESTESRLAEALVSRDVAGPPLRRHRWRAVLLACHGLLDVEWPTLSSLALTPGEGGDGFLSAGEVMRLSVTADLAVLSACQTGQGRFVRGEGVMSLARAFMHAGAPRVLVSLWDVDDRATSFLMGEFFKHWRAGKLGAAECLLRAQEATRTHVFEGPVREKTAEGLIEVTRKAAHWGDPGYWAAWVLWGLPD